MSIERPGIAPGEQVATGYRTQSRDTSPEAERILFDHYRQLSAADKILLVRQLCRAAETFALAGARRRHPGASEEELQMRVAATRFDAPTLREAFGWCEPGHDEQ